MPSAWEAHDAEGTASVVHLVVALGGLGFWVLSSALMLLECVHSLDHALGDPSWLARLFQYGSPFPGALVILVTGLVVGVLWVMERRRPDGEKEAPGIHRALPLVMAACFALFAAISGALYVLDFVGNSAYGDALQRVAALNSLLALQMAVYHFWKWWPIPYFCAACAAWAAWSVVLSHDVRLLLRHLPDCLPSIFPTLSMAIIETMAVLVIVFSAAAFAWRRDTSRPFSGYVFAGIAWFALLHLVVTAGALAPYHHMCFVIRPMGFQKAVTAGLTLAFLVSWAIIVRWTLRANPKRQHLEGETS